MLQRRRIRADQRWEELGLAATAFQATEADIAQAVIDLVVDRLARGEIELTAAALLEAARFLRDIENRELEAETGRTRFHASWAQMVRVFEIVGDVLGPAAFDDVYVAARNEADIAKTLWLDEFAALRQSHCDWLDKLPPPYAVCRLT